ncbi:MFS transporter [Streptomyces pinistramenti]|uniref:MFS transporter n=1 Tax=Streptomyces pinistramenti TaxID=2884812 RepID=UPI001D08EC94|nr:MFS transporter [Streptomyces pinistramenti]
MPEATSRRFWSVIAPLAPWAFGAPSIALAYLPGLVRDRLGNNALMFSAVVTMLTMVAGIMVQPLARRVNHPERPYLIATALGIVVAGLLLGAMAAASEQWWLIAVAALVLGADYGCCLVYGLTEVQRMADPANLGRLTALFQAVACLGFGAPYLLAVVEHVLSATPLLLVVAALAALALALARTTYRAGRGTTPGPAAAATS